MIVDAAQAPVPPPWRLPGRPRPVIWILHTTGLGANRQLAILAAALGGDVTVKNTLDPPIRALFDRFSGGSRRSIPAPKADRLCAPWPDLVLFGGGRSWVDAVRIRRASGGRTKIVCIGRPGAPLGSVDLILTTPQYGLPQQANVVELDLPLNVVDPERLAAASRVWQARFDHLPHPWTGVLLGGDSGSYRLTLAAARRLGRALADLAGCSGGSVLITTSPRTRVEVLEAVLSELEAPAFHYRFAADDPGNPLHGILALAERFVVTADSASMLAEACATGRPVACFEPDLRWPARLLERSFSSAWPPGLRRAWEAWRLRATAQGRWIPARRMQRIHRSLEQQGLIGSVAEIDRLVPNRQPGRHDLQRAVAAVHALLAPDGSDAGGRPVDSIDLD